MKKFLGLIIAAILIFVIFPVNGISAENEAGREYQIKITVMGTDGSIPIEYTYDDIVPAEDKIYRFTKTALIELGDKYMHDAKLLGEGWPAYNVSDLSASEKDKDILN